MKHWWGLVYLVIGIAVGVIVAGALAVSAAGDDEVAGHGDMPGRYEMKAVALEGGGAYVFMLDRQTGTVYSRARGSGWSWDAWEPVRQDSE